LSRRTRGESRRVAGKVYRVKLDYGEMAFTIDPQIGSTWTVEAGAYDVRVVGTIFTVKRDPDSESIEVHVERGRVAVIGKRGVALGDRTVMLEGGATLRASKGDFDIQPSSLLSSPSPSSLSPLTRAPRRLAAASSRHSLAVALAPAPGLAPDWTSLYAAGDYAGAWRAARGDGYDQLVAKLDVTGLAHLADAARLSGDQPSARSLLLALRRRFPSSREAANAAFLLGRSAADKGGAPTEASAWLQTYLVERPDGVYAEEARGRLMVVYQRAGRRADARRAARDYLGLYPTGSYAAVARSLME
jgi:FecR protein